MTMSGKFLFSILVGLPVLLGHRATSFRSRQGVHVSRGPIGVKRRNLESKTEVKKHWTRPMHRKKE